MAEKDKQFFWLKLKKDFFKRHDIQIIEAMPNGKDYVLFYLKLLCESVDHEGNLRFSENVPYNENMLSIITNTNVDIVRSAVKIFTELGMMEIMDNGTYFMREVEKMIGSETYWAQKKREQRLKEENNKIVGQFPTSVQLLSNESQTCPSKSKSIDIDKDIDIEKELICADAQNSIAQKPAKSQNLTPDDHDFWKFAKENADLAETFYKATGICPVKSQFGRWVNDLRDLAEAGISAERLQKTIAYMRSENIPFSAPGSCLKTAQYLKARGGVPVKAQQKPKYNAFEEYAMKLNGIPVPEYDVEISS